MTTATPTRGRTICGRYALLSAMSSNGVSTVWRARDQRLDTDVALREVVMPPGVSAAEQRMLCARSVREARIAAQLRHPSVGTIRDVVMEGGRAWIVMELTAGRSIDEIVRDDGPLPPAVVADIGLHVLGALDAGHQAGILHRDVRPGNILIGPDGRVTLTGFGVARTSGDSALTSAGLAVCSPPYLPPERARGDEPTPASDLWSLGATLFTAVEGRPPFDAGDPMPTLAAILAEAPAPAQRADTLEPVLAGLLDREPERRWDVERARDGLRAVLTGDDPSAPPVSRPPATPTRHQTPGPPSGSSPARRRIAPTRGQGSTLRRAGVTGVIALAVLVPALVALAVLDAPPRKVAAAPTSAPPDPTSVPSAAPSPPNATLSPPPTASLLGYVRYTHRLGFSLDVPEGWTQESRSDDDAVFREPDRGRILSVQRVTRAGNSIADYWRTGDADQRGKPGYRLLGITDSSLGGYPGADWEFSRRQGSGSAAIASHTIGRGIILDNTAYLIYLSTADADFPASKPILDRAAASFDLSR